MSLRTLNVQFRNGFNDLVSAFVHRIWGDYNSTIGRSLIGPQRVLHDYWARILDLGGKKLLWSLYWNEALPHFTAIYVMVMSHRWVATVKKVIWLCVCTSERTEAKELWRRHQGSPGALTGLRKGIVWAWCPEMQHSLVQAEDIISFLLTPTMSAFLPSRSKYFPLLL